ncbi:MAG: DNA polymerase III subunit chi [Pseudomonadales bacterium]
MTRIDFYILPDSEQQARLLFICRLVEKAYKQNHRLYIHTDSETTSKTIDDLLWSFRPESFIPHHLLEDTTAPAPIAIGHGDNSGIGCGDHHDVLINLSNDIPDFFSRFERCIEIVIQQPDVLETTRKHFGFYRERGYPLNTHDLRKPTK